MHLVCPACEAINRVPTERLGDDPKCGKCGAPVLAGDPMELTQRNFDRYLGKDELPLVVDFWASWCGPCKMMAPVFAQVAAEMKTRFRFAKVNTEQEQALAQRYNIRSIPTLALFRNGAEADRVAGAMDAGNLRAWLARQR
jgi:thioredoxin 2